MTENTFEKEISWATFEFSQESGKAEEAIKTKVVKFKELNRNDASQHKLHFKILSMFDSSNPEEGVNINSDALYDITKKAVNTLIIVDKEFTELDKRDLLNDSIGLLKLGLWLFGEKFTPFFAKLTMS